MTKSKKSRRQEVSESEEDSTSCSSSSKSDSSPVRKHVIKKSNKKKSKKTKRQRKESTPSSSTAQNSPEPGDSNRKRPHKITKDLSRIDHEDRHHSNEYDNRRLKRETEANTSNRSKWDSPGMEHSSEHRRFDAQNRQRQDDYRDRRDNNIRQNRYPPGDRGRDRDNRNSERDGERQRRSPERRREYRPNNRRDFQEQRDNGRRDFQEPRDSSRRDFQEPRDAGRRDFQDSRQHHHDNNRRDFEDRRDNRERRRSYSPRRPRKFPRNRNDGDNEPYEWGKRSSPSAKDEDNCNEMPIEKEKPNFGLSGKLTEDTNKVNGIIIKYAEPLEARKPKRRWRLYPFKGEKALATLYIHRQSCYLIGRDRKICDLPVDHPSCSKQHAALQYRLVPFEREDGTAGKRVRPYIIDLESANGTFLNNKPIESKKYFELIEKDVVKFGFSSREYVLLHENSKEDELDDDVIGEEVEIKKEEPDGSLEQSDETLRHNKFIRQLD